MIMYKVCVHMLGVLLYNKVFHVTMEKYEFYIITVTWWCSAL